MLKAIYYLGAIFFMIYELGWILSPKSKVKGVKEFKKLIEENKDRKWDDYPEEYKSKLQNKIFVSLPNIAWLFIGLFSYNWALFAVIILFNILIIAPISNASRYNYIYIFTHWINSVIGFFFGLFVLLNTYHLHIDFSSMIVSYIKSLL